MKIVNVRFSLSEFWIGVRVNKTIESFTDKIQILINFLPCCQLSLTFNRDHRIRDYGEIVERSMNVKINKYHVKTDDQGNPLITWKGQ